MSQAGQKFPIRGSAVDGREKQKKEPSALRNPPSELPNHETDIRRLAAVGQPSRA